MDLSSALGWPGPVTGSLLLDAAIAVMFVVGAAGIVLLLTREFSRFRR